VRAWQEAATLPNWTRRPDRSPSWMFEPSHLSFFPLTGNRSTSVPLRMAIVKRIS